MQICCKEGTLARFVDHWLRRQRVELRNNVLARLAANQNAAHGARIANGLRTVAPHLFGGRQVTQIGAVSFPSVQHHQARTSPSGEQLLVRLNGAAQLRDIIAEHFTKPTGLQEIPLHVDDQQGALRWEELEGIGLGVDDKRVFHGGGSWWDWCRAQQVPSLEENGDPSVVLHEVVLVLVSRQDKVPITQAIVAQVVVLHAGIKAPRPQVFRNEGERHAELDL